MIFFEILWANIRYLPFKDHSLKTKIKKFEHFFFCLFVEENMERCVKFFFKISWSYRKNTKIDLQKADKIKILFDCFNTGQQITLRDEDDR